MPDQTICQRIMRIEEQNLSARACLSSKSRGRDKPEELDPIRTCFQRDRDRILHCNAFRRLKHKTQVFLSPEKDHYRTRLTHTLEVSQIARTIARALQLNEDLTEAIALGHDLGHTPFGHAGERALNARMPDGFRHYEQSVRVVEHLEKDGAGLNLTYEVRDGILCHTAGRQAVTLEGRVVRLADKIAYINHDIDDAQRAQVLSEDEIPAPLRHAFGDKRSDRINTMVLSVIQNSAEDIGMDYETEQAFHALHEFMFSHVYTNPVAKSQESKAEHMVSQLYDFFAQHPDRIPPDIAAVVSTEGAGRAAADFIAGMTDRYAIKTYSDLFIPYAWK